MTFRERVYYFIEPGDDSGRIVDFVILSLIFLNVVALILETVEPIYRLSPLTFKIFEDVSLILFTVEYVLRLWSCTAISRFSHPIYGRLRYVVSPLAIVDLVAILPFFLPLAGLDMRFVRTIRLLRIFRVIKLARYSSALRLLGRVLVGKKEEMASIFFVLIILLILSSSLMYFVEHEAQPEAFPSIPGSMWWGIITLTTVGYGDASPVTGLGQFIAAVIAILGIGMFALPAGILGAGFVEELQKKEELEEFEGTRCPHCGEIIDD
ncbi:MAG: ion transporter [Gemmatimonadetes bacterium]|jgi:voltage-gated potassium channel|nr:ion transporter [Gemmatimonadota bacterium]